MTTPDGDKPIEQIRAGDLVLSGAGEGVTQFFPVAEARRSEFCGQILEIAADCGSELRVTPNHICFGKLAPDQFDPNCAALCAFENYNVETRRSLHRVEGEYYDELDKAEEAVRRLARGRTIERRAFFDYDERLDYRIFWRHRN